MNNEVMFSSNNQNWETPIELFYRLNNEFNFTLDVCALPETAKCKNYFTPEIDGLKQNWAPHICWMNPPYDDIISWIKKAYEESLKGALVVVLVPSRTDTKWFTEYAMKANEIRFIKGRLKFGGSTNSAPFPSCIIVFNNRYCDGLLVSVYDKNNVINPIRFIEEKDRNILYNPIIINV